MRKLLPLCLFCCLGATYRPDFYNTVTVLSERSLSPRPGKDFALFFAVDTYQSPSWRKLSSPVKDAQEIAADLYDLYGFDTLVVRNPTRNQVLDKLIEYAKKSYPADGQLLVYFTGHGHFDEFAKDGFLIPADGKASSADPYFDSYLKHAELRRRISGIPCNHILLAVDACFSGTLDAAVAMMGDTSEMEMDRPNEADARRQQKMADLLRPVTRLYITSGKKNYTPDPSEFAYRFKEGLRTLGGKDGLLNVQELYYTYLEKASSNPQIGGFEGNGVSSTFLFDYRGGYSGAAVKPPAPDRDLDGIPDSRDACPDEWGKMPNGCLDSDGDGVANKDDQCPYDKGNAANKGCPPAPADRDGDGVPDGSDPCPDAKGPEQFQGCPDSDGDGVPDNKDDCPGVKGSSGNNGCPVVLETTDRDKDNVPDASDLCPDIKGLVSFQGCPDTDEDGVPDNRDKCPREKGKLEKEGCPDKTAIPNGNKNVVTETFDMMSFGSRPCFRIEFPGITTKALEEHWRNYVHQNYGGKLKKNKSGELYASRLMSPGVSTDQFSLYSTIEDTAQGALLTVWYDMGAYFLARRDNSSRTDSVSKALAQFYNEICK